jgi:hypothetical protein
VALNDMNYTLAVALKACKLWFEEQSSYDSQLCQVFFKILRLSSKYVFRVSGLGIREFVNKIFTLNKPHHHLISKLFICIPDPEVAVINVPAQ